MVQTHLSDDLTPWEGRSDCPRSQASPLDHHQEVGSETGAQDDAIFAPALDREIALARRRMIFYLCGMSDAEQTEAGRFALHRIPNSLVVLLAVALLLRGPAGAFEAFWTYTKSLVETLFGGEAVFVEVLCQTAPLTLSAAVITFFYRCRVLSLRTLPSIVGCSVIVVGATWMGGQLRSVSASHLKPAKSEASDGPTQSPLIIGASTSAIGLPLQTASHRQPLATISRDQIAVANEMPEEIDHTISVEEAVDRILDFDDVTTDAAKHDWRDNVPRVALLPEPGSVIGVVAKAINQVLGYLAYYRPRLFFAAIMIGVYIGWSWQPYFESLALGLVRHS